MNEDKWPIISCNKLDESDKHKFEEKKLLTNENMLYSPFT